MTTGCDHLVRLEHDVVASRLARLLAGAHIDVVQTKQTYVFDAVDPMHEAV
jgi:hypothetical protein